jgi:hypothetical protein
LDKLCADLAKVTIPEPPLFVERVVASGNLSIGNNESLSPDRLVEGIEVVFSEEIGIGVRGIEPILRLWIDFPFPADRSQRATWRMFLGLANANVSPIIGTIPLSLAGKIEVNAAGNGLHWRPDKNTQFLLKTAPTHKFGLKNMDEPPITFDDLPLKAYLSVRGDCVWTRKEPRRYLDGEVLAMQDADNLFAMEPKMLDRQLAADYRIWFYLVM